MVSLTGALAEELATQRVGAGDHLPGARRARRGPRSRGRRDRDRGAEPRAARCSAPGARCSTRTTRRCSPRPPGIYTEPPLPDDELDRAMVNSVCVLALRMDVLRYDAWHDPLTGLDDRRSFDRLLEMAVANSTRYSWAFALVLIDMDLLKRINDSHGHAAGDIALRDLAERMQHTLRYGDNAARIGGDEFAMILPNTDADAVAPLLERIRATPGLRPEAPEFSFGVALCPDRGRHRRRAVRARRRPPPRAQAGAEGATMTLDDLEFELRKLPGRAGRRLRRSRRRADGATASRTERRPRRRARAAAAGRGDAASRRATATSRSRSRSCAGARRRAAAEAPTTPARRDRHRDRRRAAAADAAARGRRRRRRARRRRAARPPARGCSRCCRSPTPTRSRCTSCCTAGARSGAPPASGGLVAVVDAPRSTRCAASARARGATRCGRARSRTTAASTVSSRSASTSPTRGRQLFGLAGGSSAIDAGARATLDALNRQINARARVVAPAQRRATCRAAIASRRRENVTTPDTVYFTSW